MAISKLIFNGVTQMDATPATATAADIVAPLTAMLADGVLTTGTGSGGGSSSGLVYETGTWTPAEDISRGEINFANTHSEVPILIVLSDVSSYSTLPTSSSVAFVWYDAYKMFGGYPYGIQSTRNAVLFYIYRGTGNTSTTGGLLVEYSSDVSDDSSASYSRYFATETGFKPYSYSANRYWRSGRTYKWIAVWKPTT